MTQQEYYAVSIGMTMQKVHSTFGSYGRVVRSDGHVQTRIYPICNAPGKVHCIFKKSPIAWHLQRKWADAERITSGSP